MRWRIDLAYDGTNFHGWATQPDLRTVQGTLEEWIPRVLRLTSPVQLVVAGRTDAGVHARAQVCHLDLPSEAPVEHLLHRLRAVLPEDVVVHRITPAPEGFDARFSAVWRRYCYRLSDGAGDPLARHVTAPVRHPLDVDAMQAGAQSLIGLRDFAPFCKSRKGATTIRKLLECDVRRHAKNVEVWLTADAFCHSMVRSVVGALVAVGTGVRDQAWLTRTAQLSSRANDVTVMPARGLTLEAVGYPPDEELAQRAQTARAIRTLEQP